MHRAAHSSSQVLGGERYRLITPQCETLWCSWRMCLSERPGVQPGAAIVGPREVLTALPTRQEVLPP